MRWHRYEGEAVKWLFLLLALLILGGARDPILVPEVSQHEIQVRQGFTGTELLLFGAILTPEGTRAGQDYDIVVVLKGPTRSIILREKQRFAGIWINADSAEFRSAPTFFSNRFWTESPRATPSSITPAPKARRPLLPVWKPACP